jgi:tetratricopeptide (TPR) repeat protein
VKARVKRLAAEEKQVRAQGLSSRGTELLRQGQAQDALLLLAHAHWLAPDDMPTTVNLAGALIMVGRHQQAVSFLESARDRDPTNVMVWINLGAAYLGDRSSASDEEQRKAIAAFERALEIDPVAPNVHYSLGLIHRDRGEMEQAIRRFYQAIQANPLDQHARRAWERLGNEARDPSGVAE